MAEHNTLTGSSLHECKQISTAATSDSGKVITPSASTAGVGVLRSLTWGEITSRKEYITVELDDISTASSTYVPTPAGGTVTKAWSVIHGAIATADSTLTIKPAGTAATGGTITVAYSGSAAGDIDSCTPTANNTVTAGGYIEVETDGASTNTVRVTLTIEITLSDS